MTKPARASADVDETTVAETPDAETPVSRAEFDALAEFVSKLASDVAVKSLLLGKVRDHVNFLDGAVFGASAQPITE